MNKSGDQLSLFSSKAATRATDGPNSRKAADKMNNSGAVQEHESDVLKAVKQYPGSTQKQLGERMAQEMLNSHEIYLDLDTIKEIIYIASQPHKRLAQMGDTTVKIKQSPENIYFALEK